MVFCRYFVVAIQLRYACNFRFDAFFPMCTTFYVSIFNSIRQMVCDVMKWLLCMHFQAIHLFTVSLWLIRFGFGFVIHWVLRKFAIAYFAEACRFFWSFGHVFVSWMTPCFEYILIVFLILFQLIALIRYSRLVKDMLCNRDALTPCYHIAWTDPVCCSWASV